ncbi:MAG: hypothetical protein A2Y33_01385 [Spirochaetes bacterium GWF1_51_8]|nr:MAG: hypothetical protein A2Y33_01385 [Spirochaetes bacterium GWF1_51_8]
MEHSKRSVILLTILFALSLVAGIYLVISSTSAKSSPLSGGGVTPHAMNTVAVIEIDSAIMFGGRSGNPLSSPASPQAWISQMKSLEDDPNVPAVILRINSPGGTVAATQEIYNAVLRLKEKGKKIVVSMGDIAASGGYYIACAADHIVANPGTLTGSIGVIMSGMDLSGIFKKYGIGYNVIKSGKYKDSMAFYREMTPDEKQLLQSVIMDSYGQFFEAVMKGRSMEPKKLEKLADGRIFTGKQAMEAGLVDSLGDMEFSVGKAAELAGITGKPNVVYMKNNMNDLFGMLSSFMESIAGQKTSISLVPANNGIGIENSMTPIYYLYLQ